MNGIHPKKRIACFDPICMPLKAPRRPCPVSHLRRGLPHLLYQHHLHHLYLRLQRAMEDSTMKMLPATHTRRPLSPLLPFQRMFLQKSLGKRHSKRTSFLVPIPNFAAVKYYANKTIMVRSTRHSVERLASGGMIQSTLQWIIHGQVWMRIIVAILMEIFVRGVSQVRMVVLNTATSLFAMHALVTIPKLVDAQAYANKTIVVPSTPHSAARLA
mmetsp:Transcript_14272/g.29976  ORF Transcript_14272/g.29976 Transcript_14272/m.29976 type:complete len:214 (+) Transcript_14272:1006-1647(+)